MLLFIIKDFLEFLNGFFVKKIGENFYFYYDFFMEVIIFVFGLEFFLDIIKYVDIGIFRNRVMIKKFDK